MIKRLQQPKQIKKYHPSLGCNNAWYALYQRESAPRFIFLQSLLFPAALYITAFFKAVSIFVDCFASEN